MSKITFRADDDLVERLEACDASKSEVMRDALRAYLDDMDDDAPASDASDDGIDGAIANRIDELIEDRLDAAIADRFGRSAVPQAGTLPGAAGGYAPSTASSPSEFTVNVTVDGTGVGDADTSVTAETADGTTETADGSKTAGSTGGSARSEPEPTSTNASGDGGRAYKETADDDAAGRKTPTGPPTGRPESVCGGCGENVPEEHVYCPNCGEKQSHRAFCECGDEVRTDWAFCPGCGRRTPAADVLNDR